MRWGYHYCFTHDYQGNSNKAMNTRFYVSCLKFGDEDPATAIPNMQGVYRWEIDVTGHSPSDPKSLYKQRGDFQSASQLEGPWKYYSAPNINWNTYVPSQTPPPANSLTPMVKANQQNKVVWHDNLSQPADRAFISASAIHPGANRKAILKWVAPRDGVVLIQGVMRDASPGNTGCPSLTVDGVFGRALHLHDGGTKLSQFFHNYVDDGDIIGKSVDHWNFDMDAGDELWFVVEPNQNHACDATFWNPSIEYR